MATEATVASVASTYSSNPYSYMEAATSNARRRKRPFPSPLSRSSPASLLYLADTQLFSLPLSFSVKFFPTFATSILPIRSSRLSGLSFSFSFFLISFFLSLSLSSSRRQRSIPVSVKPRKTSMCLGLRTLRVHVHRRECPPCTGRIPWPW